MAEQAYAYVTLIPVAKGFQSAVAKELSGVGGAGGSAGKQAGDQFSNGFGGALKGLAKVAATAFAAVGVIDFFKDSTTAASNFNAEFEGVNQVFGTAAGSVQAFADTAASALGISETQALNAAKQFGIFATSAGLTGDAAAGFSTQLVQAAADLGSFNDVPVDQTLAAITSGLQGSSEPLRQFGIFLDETSVAAYAAENGLGDAYDTMTSNEKTLVRQAALMEQMGVQAGDFGKYAGDFGNATKTLQATFADMQAELGQALIPALEALIPVLTEITTNVGPILLQVFEAIVPIIQALTDNLSPLFDALSPVFEILAQVGALVGEIVATVLPIFVELIGILVPVVMALASAILPLVEKLLPPFARLLEAILPFIQGLADFLIQYIIPAFEALGQLLGDTVIWAVDRLTEGLNWLQGALGPVWDFLKPIIEGLLGLAGITPADLKKTVSITYKTSGPTKIPIGGGQYIDATASNLGASSFSLSGLDLGSGAGKGGSDLAKVAAENKKKLKALIKDTKQDLIDNRKDYNKAIAEANKDYLEAQANITDRYEKAIVEATKRRDEALAGALKSYNQNVAAINEKAAKDLADIVQQSMDRLRDAYRSAVEVNIADMFASDAINKNVTGLIDGLREKLTKSRALLENAAKLASAGFSQTFIEQVVAAGTETGNELAQGILNATPDQQRELQDLFGVIETEASHGMDALAQTLYEKNGLATEELRKMYEQVLIDQQQSLAEQKRLYDEAVAEIMAAFEQEIADAKATRDEALLDAENALNEALLKANQDFVDELDKIQKQFKEKVAAFKSEAASLASEISSLQSAVNSARAAAVTKISGLKTQLNVLTPLATGGLVTGPTPALVGEAGPELVIPLDRFQSLVEASGGSGKTVNYYAAPNQSVDSEAALFQAMRRAKVVANW